MNPKECQSMLKLVKKNHAGQTRNNGKVPYWVHCDRVAKLLCEIFSQTKEGADTKRQAIILAGLGHDLYEDTKITRQEIQEKFGAEVDRLISAMTNEFGDKKIDMYIKKFKTINEEALLIKLADLYDNTIGLAYSIHENKKTDINLWWSMLDKQWQAIKNLPFKRFLRSAAILKMLVESAHQSLKDSITRYQKN